MSTDQYVEQCRDEYEQVQRQLRDLGVDTGEHQLKVREVRQQWQRRIQQLRENRDKKYA